MRLDAKAYDEQRVVALADGDGGGGLVICLSHVDPNVVKPAEQKAALDKLVLALIARMQRQ